MTADLGPAATPRPIPTPEDRMTTTAYPLPIHGGCGHTTQQHHTLDGLEADLRNAERENAELRAELEQALDRLDGDAWERITAERNQHRDLLLATAGALGMAPGDRWNSIPAVAADLHAEAKGARSDYEQLRGFNAELADERDRLRAELADAQELIAELRNNRERDDRARYDTRQEQAADLGSPAARAQDQEA